MEVVAGGFQSQPGGARVKTREVVAPRRDIACRKEAWRDSGMVGGDERDAGARAWGDWGSGKLKGRRAAGRRSEGGSSVSWRSWRLLGRIVRRGGWVNHRKGGRDWPVPEAVDEAGLARRLLPALPSRRTSCPLGD